MKHSITDDIHLEITTQDHAEQLFAAIDANREHLSVFLPWVNNMEYVQNISAYLRMCEELAEQKKEVSFVIFYKDELVGRIGLHYWNQQNRCAAIGYWLTKDAEGKGIISAACRWLIIYGFAEMNLRRIELKAAVENKRSRAIPEKMGFSFEGILRQAESVNDRFLDLALYSKLSTDPQ